MIRRRGAQPEPTPEDARIEAARATVLRVAPESSALALIDDIQQAVATARADRARLREVLDGLDPDRATADLKQALRERPSPLDPDTPHILALRRRHETVAEVRNRLDDLARRIERALVDVETLAAQTAAASIRVDGIDDDELDGRLRRLSDDAASLAAAHQELSDL